MMPSGSNSVPNHIYHVLELQSALETSFELMLTFVNDGMYLQDEGRRRGRRGHSLDSYNVNP